MRWVDRILLDNKNNIVINNEYQILEKMITPRPLIIDSDIEYIHRGMSFEEETGREIGYVIILKYLHISSNGWTEWYYAAFSERGHKCVSPKVDFYGKPQVAPNGRFFACKFKDSFDKTICVECNNHEQISSV